MKEYYFCAKNMSVGYDKEPLIEHIEIQLKKGEILTLIGPNGSGKTTVLKSIARQLTLLGGAVYLQEEDITTMGGNLLAQKMAVVLTEKLHTEMMTCEDVVATGRYPYTGRFGTLSDMDHQVVLEAMELVHVTGIRELDFTKISDGQRQRVMLARAICQEPEIIILDEPTSYLDVKHKLEFLSILQDMRRKKELTVILSLHELDLAARVSDQILCIREQGVERYGTPEEIFSPGYIRELFGIKSGSFDEGSGTVELEMAGGTPEVFVIAGCGQGRNIYRNLQRQKIPFATGIIYENDLDYPVATSLAVCTVTTKAFEKVEQETIEKAKKMMDTCQRIICCRSEFGSLDIANKELYDYAKQMGKVEEEWQK